MAAKNTSFNYKKMSSILSANNDSNTIAVAEDIAYDWTDTSQNELGAYQFSSTKNVKQKISEIEDQITNIQGGVGTISDSVRQASDAKVDAQNAQIAAEEARDAAQQYVSSITQSVENIQDTLRDLVTSFDADARIQILGESAYEALNPKDPNTMYFLYDDSY